MDILLWRHAEAVDADGLHSDLDRPLTKRGRKQAKLVARWLRSRLPPDCRILVSPALRTRETVVPLGLPHEIEPAIAPGASAEAILAATGWPGKDGAVLLVGHQPGLGEVAGRLLTGRALGLSVRKGALWWLTARRRGGRAEVTLRAVIDAETAWPTPGQGKKSQAD
jgi:phosphohistidine phosphatase